MRSRKLLYYSNFVDQYITLELFSVWAMLEQAENVMLSPSRKLGPRSFLVLLMLVDGLWITNKGTRPK